MIHVFCGLKLANGQSVCFGCVSPKAIDDAQEEQKITTAEDLANAPCALCGRLIGNWSAKDEQKINRRRR